MKKIKEIIFYIGVFVVLPCVVLHKACDAIIDNWVERLEALKYRWEIE